MFPQLHRSSVSPGTTAWAMVLVGATAGVACGVGIDFWIARHPDGWIILTFLVIALGLGLATALEGIFHQTGITRTGQLAGWPYGAACIASTAYGLTYGPYVFINTWWQDDWGYLLWDRAFSPGILTTVLNDHLSPLLNLIIWTTTRLFGFDYIGAALLQHGVFILLLLAVAHLLRRASRNAGLLVLFLAAYASWPSHEDARTFFCGGFWLTASAAFLMTYLLHAQTRITDDKALTPSALVTSAALAAMTVFISSQTMLPVVFLLVLSAAPIAISRARAATMRRTAILAALSLIPTACIVVGRAVYVHRAGYDLSGLVTGELARNLIIFFSVKATLVPLEYLAQTTRLLPAALFAFLFVIPVALAIKVLWDEYAAGKATDEWAARAGLMALGCAIWLELFTQIGVARSWGSGSVLTSYYATLPLLAIWIAEFG
ncbi:MAG TPA: hypothetical protein VG222_09495, partial [Vicinamibacterales bacterium]|nr:hypothetical protein [Vicinamibacterales bacterium]